MKTYNQWSESYKDLHDFLQPMDEVDELIFNYAAEIVAPTYCAWNRDKSVYLVQMGEPMWKDEGIYFYETFSKVGDKYFFLGVLPEFEQ